MRKLYLPEKQVYQTVGDYYAHSTHGLSNRLNHPVHGLGDFTPSNFLLWAGVGFAVWYFLIREETSKTNRKNWMVFKREEEDPDEPGKMITDWVATDSKDRKTNLHTFRTKEAAERFVRG